MVAMAAVANWENWRPRFVSFDIETTGFHADFDYALCVGFKDLEGESKVLSLLDFDTPCDRGMIHADDKELMRAAHKILTNTEMAFTWYGIKFDQRFLNARMLEAGLPPLPPYAHVDLYKTAKKHFSISRNRLATWLDFLDCPIKKSSIRGKIWRAAQHGDPKAMEYIIDHCDRDVRALDWIYRKKLRPYVSAHPRIAGYATIEGRPLHRNCGGYMINHGRAITVHKGIQQRLQCKKCGGWETRPI